MPPKGKTIPHFEVQDKYMSGVALNLSLTSERRESERAWLGTRKAKRQFALSSSTDEVKLVRNGRYDTPH